MIRQLAQCPYCQSGEVALDDSMEVVLNPDDSSAPPCPHLIRVDGRYTQWGLSPLPGRKTKIARMIGSNEFEWLHPDLAARDEAQQFRSYLKELVEAGAGWQFAPAEEHTIRFISRDHKVTDASGKEYPDWEVEGTAVFVRDGKLFIQGLPGCLERQNTTWTDLSDLSPS